MSINSYRKVSPARSAVMPVADNKHINLYRKSGIAQSAVMPVADNKHIIPSTQAGNTRPYTVLSRDKAGTGVSIMPIVTPPSMTTPSGITGVVINGPPTNPTKTKQYCPACGQPIKGT